uniref:Interleukin-6 n=1 Tax=Leptobrachium leishanense TaxID=445787 RepID=A0A8C5M1V5_9ANUR
MKFTICYSSAQVVPSVIVFILCCQWAHSAPASSIIVSSGEDMDVPSRPALHVSIDLAKFIAHEADKLNKELCKTTSDCANSLEMQTKNYLNLPAMAPGDGCSQKRFNKDKCLLKIHQSLKEFQPYLLYVEKTFTGKKGNVALLRLKTMVLANNLKAVDEEPTTASSNQTTSILTNGKSESRWTQELTCHLILKAFTEYMQNSLRAIRYSNEKKIRP